MSKSAEAFRTIGEVADELDVPKHVLRFWEGKFPQIRPMKRGGGRRYYRPEDMELLRGVRHLLHAEGYTIKGVQKILREQGIDQVKVIARAAIDAAAAQGRGKKPGRKRAGAGGHGAEAAIAEPAPRISGSGQRASRGASASPGKGDVRDVVRAAIRELETCRALLVGALATARSEDEPKRARGGERT